MAKFTQRVTFIGELVISAEGMNWAEARQAVDQALLDGDGESEGEFMLLVKKVTRMEIVEDE